MADGQNANTGWSSYLAVGRESTFKTYSTCTAGIEFTSFGMKTLKDSKAIEAVRASRTLVDRIGLGKVIEGDMEWYVAADHDASQYILQNAFGGGVISSATATGDTTGSGVMDHTYSINGFDATYSSLCFNARKGDSTNGKIFEYSGVRVNELSLKAELDEALLASASLIACESSVTSNNVSSVMTNTGQSPLNFTGMRFSVESSFASLTSSSYWHVQSIEWKLANNLKADAESRRIGSDTLQVLPPGLALFELSVTMRFDTVTAYNAMLNETELAAQMYFEGNTLSGSSLKQFIRVDMPRVYIKDAGDPEIGGPDEILSAQVSFLVMQQETASGYACKMVVRNKTASYA